MSDARSMYQQVILDHNKAPRNFGALPDADRKAEGYNPLCGDQFTVYLKMDGDRITDAHFEGAGCAISKSSASIMTTILKGMTRDDAQTMFERFKTMVTADLDAPVDEQALGKLKVFSGVREFPVRVKCATLPWHALFAALNGEDEAVITE